jgi:hypothetical protein
MNEPERNASIQKVADAILRNRLEIPARIVLDVLEPISFIASQCMVFVQPLIPVARWKQYVGLFEDEASWQVLQGLVKRQDG